MQIIKNEIAGIRYFGLISLLLALGCVAICFLNKEARSSGGHDLSGMLYGGIVFFALSIGMFFGSTIAAILFAAIFAIGGIWLAIGSVLNVPFPWYVINLFFAFLLLLPISIVVRSLAQKEKTK